MSTLKDLARKAQAGNNTESTNTPAEAAAEAKKAEAPKTVNEAAGKKTNAKAAPKRKAPKVDDNWVAELTKKAQEKFGGSDEFGGAKVEFTVAKSKGRFVSLTPKLVYSDGTAKSAGAKNRIGFCTNQDWDKWFDKLHNALVAAHTSERKGTSGRRAASGQWSAFSVAVKEALNGEEVKVSASGKRFRVKGADGNVTLRREENDALVSNAGGSMDFVKKVLAAVDNVSFPEAA